MPHSTGMVLHSLFRAHHNASHTRLLQAGLGDIGSPRLLLALKHCREQGRTPSQRELADLLHVSPATIATSLKSLERNGYVTRESDPSDSRNNLISITQKALDSLDASHRIFLAVDEAMLEGFSPEEAEQLQGYLVRMRDNLFRAGGCPECCPPQPNSLCERKNAPL